MRLDIDDLIKEAHRSDRSVLVTQSNRGGYYAIEIDGRRLVEGLPSETFAWPIDQYDFDEEEAVLRDELLDHRESRLRWRRRRRERERTEVHRLVEGAALRERV